MWEAGATVLDGRFRILAAAGGTSGTEDYVAEQVSLARKVSLRVIRPELGVQPDANERFEREIKKLAAVDHPTVVRVIDSGKSEGRLYLVTEWVDGAPLPSELKAGEPLMPDRALDLLTQVAEALTAVHDQGLVHGELRPQSVLVSGARARLLDFGLARLLDAESPHERLTLVTRAIASPEYLAPEQLKGKDATPASDVWALGALAYRLLTGEAPARPHPKPLGGHLAEQHGLVELVPRLLVEDPAKRPPAREAWTRLSRLPRPSEPTLFLEAMQRPPELPSKPQPPAAAPAPAKAPPKLLESVPMLAVTPAPMPGALPPPLPAKTGAAPARWPRYALVAAALVLGSAAFLFLSSSPAREARKLIENRQPAQALEVVTKALRKQGGGSTAELMALRAAALHLTGQHRDEETAFKSVPPSAPEAVDPLVLAGLVEDFGRREEPDLRVGLRALPAEATRAVLEKFAREPVSMKQWGALRYLDLEDAAKGLRLVELYSISLESNDCAVRKIAARRLQELDDDSAVDALQRLRDTPRTGDEKTCGQDEAAAAVQALKKLK